MELAMFDAVVEQCQARGIRRIVGTYIPSKKNSMVSDHYLKLGFNAGEGSSEGFNTFHFDVPQSQPARARYIHRTANAAGEVVEDASSREAKSELNGVALANKPGCLTYR
jgi:hypothetical protein